MQEPLCMQPRQSLCAQHLSSTPKNNRTFTFAEDEHNKNLISGNKTAWQYACKRSGTETPLAFALRRLIQNADRQVLFGLLKATPNFRDADRLTTLSDVLMFNFLFGGDIENLRFLWESRSRETRLKVATHMDAGAKGPREFRSQLLLICMLCWNVETQCAIGSRRLFPRKKFKRRAVLLRNNRAISECAATYVPAAQRRTSDKERLS